MAQQPSGMTNDHGVIVTCGMFCNGEAFEIVSPVVTNATTLDFSQICKDAVKSFEGGPMLGLMQLLSSDGYVAFVSGEAMVNGKVPYRDSFAPTDNPGASSAGAVPTNVASVGVWYEDPQDFVAPQKKIGVAKFYMTGIGADQLDANTVVDAYKTNMQSYLNDMQAGFPSVGASPSKWYRVLNVPKPRTGGTPVKRLILGEPRAFTYTQKRRLVPRS